MNTIKLNDIKAYITPDNSCGQGKEVTVYSYGEKVIKIFHQNRKSPFERLSIEGLQKLNTLPLH